MTARRTRRLYCSRSAGTFLIGLLVAVLAGTSACSASGAGSTGSGPSAAQPQGGYWSLGYYPGWIQDEVPPDKIDYSATTHVLHFGRYPRADGTISMGDIDGDSSHVALVKAVHAAKRKALLVIGSEGTGAQFAAAATDKVRPKFVAAIVQLVNRYHYDGVDIDWEESVPENASHWTALLADLRRALTSRQLLTADVDTGQIPPHLAAQAAAYLDSVNVMAYWDDGSQQVNDYRHAGVPAGKLVLGLGIDHDPTYVDHSPAKVAAKTAYVQRNKLRGVSMWHIGELHGSRSDPRLAPIRTLVAAKRR